MRFLALTLSRQLDRTVIDETGLKGTYEFELKWVPDFPGNSPPATPDQPQPVPQEGPSIFTAIEEQLGLKLEPAKGPVEILIIDHAEKASEN